MTHRLATILTTGAMLAASLTVGITAPAEAAGPTNRICASRYGTRLYYDTDFRNGYSWHRFKPGTCRTNDDNDVYQARGGQSLALIRGLYRVQCINFSVTRIDPRDDNGRLQGYPRKGCKN